MQTPYLPKKVFGDDFNRVYEPAEDSFALLDALENDLQLLQENVSICLEIGSGSGVIVTALSQALNLARETANLKLPMPSKLILATDLNWDACKTTKKCAAFHEQSSKIQVVRTNLAESLVDRLEGSVDLLIFNPPYVLTNEDETNPEWSHTEDSTYGERSIEKGQLHLSWAGGPDGRKLIDTFLSQYVPKLMSKPSGAAYMVALDKNNIEELSDYLVEHKIQGKVVVERQAGMERLYVLRYVWLK